MKLVIKKMIFLLLSLSNLVAWISLLLLMAILLMNPSAWPDWLLPLLLNVGVVVIVQVLRVIRRMKWPIPGVDYK